MSTSMRFLFPFIGVPEQYTNTSLSERIVANNMEMMPEPGLILFSNEHNRLKNEFQ